MLPKTRLEEFPVDLPPRSELTELYEVFRLLESAVERVLSSSKTGVEQGDGSPCDRWYQVIKRRLYTGDDVIKNVPPSGAQQEARVNHSVQEYRACYGDGSTVTDFDCIQISQPRESEETQLFGLGVFDHGEKIRVPVAPDSSVALPIYPQNE